jgi:large conductance mechanosensitive channel
MEMLKEFKEFISKGNVMDMAVGIIIGGAFTSIVTALVDNIITPLLGIITGGVSFAERVITVGSASIQYGLFIDAIIKFLLVSWVLFMIIKAMNKAKSVAVKEEEPAPEEPEEKPADIALLEEIRDLLKQPAAGKNQKPVE